MSGASSASPGAGPAGASPEPLFGIYRLTSVRKASEDCDALGEDEIESFDEPFLIVGPVANARAHVVSCVGVADCRDKHVLAQKNEGYGGTVMARLADEDGAALVQDGGMLWGTKEGECDSAFRRHRLERTETGLRLTVRESRFRHPTNPEGRCASEDVLRLGKDQPCTSRAVYEARREQPLDAAR